MDIKILIADDHSIAREGLKALLEKEKNMVVVAEAKNGREAVRLAIEAKPDIIIMDINMPELNGIEATRQIIAETPQAKVIALSMYSDRRYISRMLKVGVAAYLLKNNASEELVTAIRAVLKNQGYLSHKVANVVIKDYSNRLGQCDESPLSRLTSREIEVLQLIAEGFSSGDIADRLCVSVKTISSNRRQLMDKLKTDSIAELTKISIREGLISLDD
ncbi:MAG: response regulator transcription factor [Desulfobacula sp.]|jgi:DNA-binding NarL/FixJ family response regulator|uniref:response regulator n=1 Tax=Desulfobacula sp. TaxID=2593537 RepID=UPI001D901D8F|nr:response regulator transcription factor [Desulfobacula sp.]MBT4506518.1 response regulator transcription factor [Desulfobacula sp.]MBT6341259.1 response regulator transcription factor [Desulfobacula sp.]MBT7261237.1 response regulator transcription factor [Desulfobacula sp.]